jgi:hypothetical protein
MRAGQGLGLPGESKVLRKGVAWRIYIARHQYRPIGTLAKLKQIHLNVLGILSLRRKPMTTNHSV